jgi:hypothetical protein
MILIYSDDFNWPSADTSIKTNDAEIVSQEGSHGGEYEDDFLLECCAV